MKTFNALVISMAAAALATACADVQGTEKKPARPVKAQVVALSTPASGVHYSASIEPFEQVPVAFKSSGYVDALLERAGVDRRLRTLQAGDVVKRGTVLARVREHEYRQRVDQGRAKAAEAQASLEKARLDLDRARRLFGADSLTKPDLDAAQAALDAGQARLDAARADVELATTALGDCALRSPATGVVLERKVETGSLVGSGTVGFVIGDITAVKAHFGIPDSMIGSVQLGEAIDLVAEGVAGTTFSGRVSAIAPAADPQSRVFDVEVTIPNDSGRLRPGMIGSVSVRRAAAGAQSSVGGVPTLPLAAIVRADKGSSDYAAFVVERQGDIEIARLRHVQLGDVIGNGIAVLKGVGPGDRVIVTGATLLVDGEPVRVIP